MNQPRQLPLLVAILALLPFGCAARTAPALPGLAPERYGQIPMTFEVNQGQTAPEVRFLGRGPGYAIFLTPTEAVLSLRSPARPAAAGERPSPSLNRRPLSDPSPARSASRRPAVLRLRLAGANGSPTVTGLGERPGKSHYLGLREGGRAVTNVAHYGRVRYDQVYPGIDLEFYGQPRQLEYDFTVAPGADPRAIALEFEGANRLELDGQGNLVVHLGDARLVQHAPVIYQMIHGERREVRGGYALHRRAVSMAQEAVVVGFELATYDHDHPLIVDPVLSYSTYLGGTGQDYIYGIAADSAGSAYVTGQTESPDFPMRLALQGFYGGGLEIFVTKLNPAGSDLVYSTYLGGDANNQSAAAIAVDGNGRAYIAGSVDYDPGTTPRDAFLLRLSADGMNADYVSIFGGLGEDRARGVAVDGAGNAYVVGSTSTTNFFTTNAIQPVFGGGSSDGFLRKYDPSGALLVSTFLGGSDFQSASDVKVDGAGNILMVGANDEGHPGNLDAFVLKLNTTASTVVYSYTFGGSGGEWANAVAVDSGNVYVAGYTTSTNFPTTNALQTVYGGSWDGFLRKYDASGHLIYSTYLGQPQYQILNGIGLDQSGNIHLVGQTGLADPLHRDAFYLVLNNAATQVLTSMNFGTGAGEAFTCVAVRGNDAYIGGWCGGAGFPTTAGAFHPSNRGANDGVVLKLRAGGASLSITDVTLLEGDSGTTNATFTVSLSPPSLQTVKVSWTTADVSQSTYDVSAAAGEDYVAASGGLIFSPGETNKTVTVTVLGDTQIEADEPFYVVLLNPLNASVQKSIGTCTIINDDFPQITVGDVTVTERDTGQTTNAVFLVVLSAPSPQTITVHYATANGTAVAPADYTTASGTLTFLPGETAKTVTVVVQGDLLNEANETFFVNLSNPTKATLAKAQGVGTILDDDPLPSLSINNVTVSEPDTGAANAVFTVTLSAASGQTVTVNWATADDTATASADYVAASGALAFAPGQTSKTITNLVKGDLLNEANETFFVNLSNAANATIADAQGVCTILDNDPLPAITIGDVSVLEPATGTTNYVILATLSVLSGQFVTVNCATANGTATAPADYTAIASRQIMFVPGFTNAGLVLEVKGDTLPEPDKMFFVNLSGAVNATIARGQARVTVLDNSQPRLLLRRMPPNLALEWPTSYAGFTLDRAGLLRSSNMSWSVVTNPVTIVGSSNRVVVPWTATNNFFRLRKP